MKICEDTIVHGRYTSGTQNALNSGWSSSDAVRQRKRESISAWATVLHESDPTGENHRQNVDPMLLSPVAPQGKKVSNAQGC